MHSKVTERQKLILEFIKDKIKTCGYPPSVREIGQAVGLKSSSTVHAYLVELEKMGYVRRDPSTPRAVIPVMPEQKEVSTAVELPVIGDVAAGVPILAEENISTYFPVPIDMMGSGTHFILKVKGESMIEAGILDGDYLIIRQQDDASNGEIVVALVEEEATVKRLYKHNDHIELRPENSTMQPIIVNDATVIGKVTCLLRKM
jgi:repressor LexA